MHARELRERFWRSPPSMPRGVTILQQDSLVVAQRGPGGIGLYDLARVQLPSGDVPLLITFRPALFPADVPRLKKTLVGLEEEVRRRASTGRELPEARIPMVVTEVASPGVIDRAEREDIALADLNGTLLLNAAAAFIRTEGRRHHRRASRAPVFHGKGSRIVRLLLTHETDARWSVRQMSADTETSYAYAHGVTQRLEEGGYLERLQRPAGLRLRDPVGLLRAWLDSGRPTAASVQGFYAPSTTPDSLARGMKALSDFGMRGIFSMASAIHPEERVATQLPHALYVSGALGPVVEAFGLRDAQPHNFLVLRPEPAAETEAGGIYMRPRELPHGRGVALPQLAVDFWHSGGRGRDQAEELVLRYARSLPLVVETDV